MYYTGNIRDFLANTNGLAILVDRPWNRHDRSTIDYSAGRFAVADGFAEIPSLIAAFKANLLRG
jgi:hypothetical protein